MSILKKQGVAWAIAIIMIVVAVVIGISKSRDPAPGGPSYTPPSSDSFYVYDDANVLSASDERKLSDLNRELYRDMDVVIACVTTNYNRNDLGDFALDYAKDIDLREYDFIVVLDISGENYWLVQGAGLVNMFTDTDCDNYAWNYMENDFARGDYGDALLSLTDALADWYYDHY